jgi:hypothetical protein
MIDTHHSLPLNYIVTVSNNKVNGKYISNKIYTVTTKYTL